jgi:hypothetical protein
LLYALYKHEMEEKRTFEFCVIWSQEATCKSKKERKRVHSGIRSGVLPRMLTQNEDECAVMSVDPEERRWSVLSWVWTQKKGDRLCCHECEPRRKEMECAVMSVNPEERRWSVLPWVFAQKKKIGSVLPCVWSQKESKCGCAAISVEEEWRRPQLLQMP